jgi:hypothetical protein
LNIDDCIELSLSDENREPDFTEGRLQNRLAVEKRTALREIATDVPAVSY